MQQPGFPVCGDVLLQAIGADLTQKTIEFENCEILTQVPLQSDGVKLEKTGEVYLAVCVFRSYESHE